MYLCELTTRLESDAQLESALSVGKSISLSKFVALAFAEKTVLMPAVRVKKNLPGYINATYIKLPSLPHRCSTNQLHTPIGIYTLHGY